MMAYFLIHGAEDGIVVEELEKEEIIKRITPDEWGDTYYGHKEILSELPNRADDNKLYEQIVIIKGAVVTPKAKEVIKKYELN